MKHHYLFGEYAVSIGSYILGVVTNSELTAILGGIAAITTIIRNIYLMRKEAQKTK